MNERTKKDVLIAYLPTHKDLNIAVTKKWYRIPVKSQNVPTIVKNKGLKLIAFYQPKIFKMDAFAVRYYGIVDKISIKKRKHLFRNELKNEKSEDLYYKIQFDNLLRLPRPIYSRRHRRILFITTNLDRFENAEEINDLFFESPIEEKFWEALKRNEISAERQYLESISKSNYFLDFAVFCKKCKIAIECNGDTFHNKPENIKKDKRRDNSLKSKGWNVFRYTSEDINYHLEDSISQVKETINYYGGFEDTFENEVFQKYLLQSNNNNLFSYME